MSRSGATRMPETHEVADRLHSLAIHLLRRVRKGDDEFGLTAPRLSALSVVVFRGPLSVSDLAQAEGVTTPTMTRLVQALESDGLVERSQHPADRRVAVLRPTKHGRSLLEAGRKKRLTQIAGLLEGLTAEELKTVAAAITLLEPTVRR